MNIQLCRPANNSFVVIESIHSDSFFKVAEITQVYRQIIGFCNYETYLFDGKPLDGAPSQWQFIRHFLSGKRRITTAPTERNGLYYVYRGVRNAVKPLNSRVAAGLLSREYSLGEPRTPFTWGSDPIPHMQLYGRNDVHFVMPGNSPPPTAFAIYTPKTGKLEEIRESKERARVLNSLVNASL